MGKKKRREDGLRSCLAALRTPFAVLLPSLTIELTVSILQLLCSHLILIPGLLRSVGVAVAMYFNGNPFTIGDRCSRARSATDVTCEV